MGLKSLLKLYCIGRVDVKFKSSFENAGINQTRHRIYLDITTNIKSIIPVCTQDQNCINEIMIAETIIVGDIPQTYYNLEGVENLDEKDTIDFM